MPDRNRTAQVVGEWIAKAENDLLNAAHTLKLKENCPTDTVCFHAQQCVEKYLKAVLVWKGIDFPKVHDIEEIISLLPRGISIPLSAEEQGRMTDYATMSRYPGWPMIAVTEARTAVAAARRVRKALRSLLKMPAPRTLFD